jgi:uncharacterized membrane protein
VPWEYAIVGTLIIIGLVIAMAPAPRPAATANAAPVTFVQVQTIVAQRCVMCHNAALQNKNVALHTPELIAQHSAQIYQQAVLQKTMPFNNATQITPEERDVLGRWFTAGAPTH